MASPQKEKGNTGIAHDLLEQIVKFRFPSASPIQIWLFIVRKTYGFQKPTDRLSLSQIIAGTGLSRQTVNESLKWLVKACLLVKGNFNEKGTVYGVNKDYDQWVVNPHRLVKRRHLSSLGAQTHNKNNYNKKRYDDKSSPTKSMYQEDIIELDELGEEIPKLPKKYKNRARFYTRIIAWYVNLIGEENVSGSQWLPVLKDLTTLVDKKHPDWNEAKTEAEIKAHALVWKKYCEANNLTFTLRGVLKNWNTIENKYANEYQP